jgi:homoserine kinase type II
VDVFLLWHVHELASGEEDAKLVGVYATADDAERARRRVADQPDLRDSPEGFEVSRYVVARDHWTEGFVTVTGHEQSHAEPSAAAVPGRDVASRDP